MTLMSLIEERKSVRKYSDKPIPKEVLRKILEAGRLAPSWTNIQSWKFIVVQNQENKEMLSELACGQPQVRKCDTVIVCVADKNAWSREEYFKIFKQKGLADEAIENLMSMPGYYPPLLGDEIVNIRTVEQLTYAISYMMLEAEENDVRSCIIGAMANEFTKLNPELSIKVKEKLGLNDNEIITTMITLGYEAESKPTVKLRKDFDDIIFLEKVGNKF